MSTTDINCNKIWKEALSLIEPKLSQTFFDVWIRNLTPIQVTDDRLYLLANLASTKNTVNKNYIKLITDSVHECNQYINKVVLFCEDDTEEIIPIVAAQEEKILKTTDDKKKENKSTDTIFDETYTFSNFVVGGFNDIAYAAAMAVAQNPGKSHNPLFIYGGVGLGKTHIIHAIGNYIRENNGKAKILYVTTANFTNDYIESLKGSGDNQSKFREKYRAVDILMLDDIQFINGKVATQEALFHTFNDLYQSKKQIIFTSDRHPKDLNELEDRLKSRFQSGLTVDISYPDLETRIAILRQKSQAKRYNISDNVLSYIAEKIDTNIRELEGALSKVMFYCTLNAIAANDIGVVNLALKDELDSGSGPLTIDYIVDKVCLYFKLDKKEIVGKKKTKQIAEARQIAIYIISEKISVPLITIGEYFGGRDHSTIIHARDKISDMYNKSDYIRMAVDDIGEIIKGN